MENRNSKTVLVFDVWADYAHFRKFYTTTSPLTFSVPPRTALCGLIGAISGLEKNENEYLKYFPLNIAHIGIRILNPIKKVMVAQNLIHTKPGIVKGPGMNLITQRTQINFEFLKLPKYRIYFAYSNDNSDLYPKLKQNLIEHKSVYTPVLGLSENIANFSFVGEFKAENSSSENYIQINTAVAMGQIIDDYGTNFNYDAEYYSERVPLELTTERIVTKYDDILFERNGKPIEVKLKNEFYKINNKKETENIVFLE